jgi:hypothetical protein
VPSDVVRDVPWRAASGATNQINAADGKPTYGSEPQPGDERQGAWSRQRLERRDHRFTARLERALRRGDESMTRATFDPRRR